MKAADQTELDPVNCVALLRTQRVGRLIYDDGGAQVRPVNYIVIADQILLRMDRRFDDHTRVLFEIDCVDTIEDQGWSVIVEGRAYSVPLEPAREEVTTEPWAPGDKCWSTTIVIDSVTGRMVTARRSSLVAGDHGYL